MSGFFLFWVVTGQFIGPLPQDGCQQAAIVLQGQGVVCRQPYLVPCPVPDRPEMFTSCPVFDIPKVTVKP